MFKLIESSGEHCRTVPLDGAKKANFFKIGKFKRPSLMHRTSQHHQIFSFAKKMAALVEYQVLSRLCSN